jgi:hypothetical protein
MSENNEMPQEVVEQIRELDKQILQVAVDLQAQVVKLRGLHDAYMGLHEKHTDEEWYGGGFFEEAEKLREEGNVLWEATLEIEQQFRHTAWDLK